MLESREVFRNPVVMGIFVLPIVHGIFDEREQRERVFRIAFVLRARRNAA